MKKFISWVEIPAKDLHRAVKFYNSVMQVDLQIADFGEEKMAGFPNGEGAISQAPNFQPSSEGTIVSLNAGNEIDGVIERIMAGGGKIITGKTRIEAEGMGYFALFTDTEGNKVGLHGAS
jgi:predicted enzyme related to lactoylglutathione lyase